MNFKFFLGEYDTLTDMPVKRAYKFLEQVDYARHEKKLFRDFETYNSAANGNSLHNICIHPYWVTISNDEFKNDFNSVALYPKWKERNDDGGDEWLKSIIEQRNLKNNEWWDTQPENVVYPTIDDMDAAHIRSENRLIAQYAIPSPFSAILDPLLLNAERDVKVYLCKQRNKRIQRAAENDEY